MIKILFYILTLILIPINCFAEPLQARIYTVQESGAIGLDLWIYPDKYPSVKGVFPNSPCFKAGIQKGDLLIAVNGESTLYKTLEEVDMMIPNDTIGSRIEFIIQRGNNIRTVNITVAPRSTIGGF